MAPRSPPPKCPIRWPARRERPTISPTPGSWAFLRRSLAAWIGYVEKKSLGEKETGARAALPIWMQFMTVALAGKDPGEFQPAPGLGNAAVAQKKVDTQDVAPGDGELH